MTCLVGVVISGVVRLGPLRFSAYGLCAAVGLVGALWLSLRTARMVELEPAEIWDAGLFGLGAAFVVSRLLLVVRNWTVFLHYPMQVLALPSLSYWAMGITAVAMGVYLLRKKMSVLAMMDAWAPCAALLAAFLEVGHWLEGSDAGMPWRRGGGLLPAQELGLLLSVALMVGLLWELGKHTSGAKAPIPGRPMRPEAEASGYESLPTPESRWGGRSGLVGGLGLVLGGVAAFLVTMVTQPTGMTGDWLQSGQWIAIGAMIVGVVMLLSATKERVPVLSRVQVAELIENLLSGQARPYDHEKIIYKKFSDPVLIEVQKDFPCVWGPMNKQDEEMLLGHARMLRENPSYEADEELQ